MEIVLYFDQFFEWFLQFVLHQTFFDGDQY